MSNNIGVLINKLALTKRTIDAHHKEVSNLEREKAGLEAEILALLDDQGAVRVSIPNYTVSVTEAVVPTVQNWDQFYEYIVSTNRPWLLQRRPSVQPFRDLLKEGEEVPGVVPFNRRTLSLRSA
jgi:hypothetical protein